MGTVSGVDIARQFRNGADGTQDPAVFQHMLDAAAAARTAEVRGEGPQSFQLFPDTAEQARARGGQYGLEGFEYDISGPTAFQNAASPKELHWIDGASHNDLYYKKQYVDPSVEKLTGFFTQNLGQAA